MAPGSPSIAVTSLARALRVRGPTLAHDLRVQSGLSPATFTRTISRMRGDVLAVGATRSLVYALRRVIPGLPAQIPVVEMGLTRRFATLHPVEPSGFYVQGAPHVHGSIWGFTPDLPWFLHDLRPAGFLGRLAPRQHPELHLPADLLLWSADHVLRWLHEWGTDGVGNLLVGDPASRRWQASEADAVPEGERSRRYPLLAEEAMSLGVPGSSAGGEQPKFLAMRGQTPVLVKFSPPTTNPIGRRTADLLRCEHHALVTLQRAGIPAASSVIIEGADRVFLEVERFDRIGRTERLGLVSLLAVAAWCGADIHGWTAAADDLVASGMITQADQERMYLLDRFGALIGNTDRHAGNLSFFFVDGRVGALAPVYDMLPMRYAVRAGEYQTSPLPIPVPDPRFPSAWRQAWEMAILFWTRVAEDVAIEDELRTVAVVNGAVLAGEGARFTR